MRLRISFTLLSVALALSPAFARPKASADERIDHLFSLCLHLADTDRSQNCFYQRQYWRKSRQVADEFGIRIIPSVMKRARLYPADERSEGPWSMLLPLVAILPRDQTIASLRHYEKSSNKAERLWAHEYLIEFDLSARPDDVKKTLDSL